MGPRTPEPGSKQAGDQRRFHEWDHHFTRHVVLVAVQVLISLLHFFSPCYEVIHDAGYC